MFLQEPVMTVQQLPTIDLLSLIEQRAPVRFKRVASSHGGEYAGNCPWCGGTDRFHCWPHSERPRYWCRSCQAKGDAIEFLKTYSLMTFRDACDELGVDPSDMGYTGTASPLRLPPEPPVQWMETAALFISAAQRYLFSPGGKRYLDYLLGRGITVETIKKKNIGCVPLSKEGRWTESPFERWGLSEENLTPEQFAKGCVRIPDGLFFPHYVNGQCWKLSMYRPFEPEKKYRRGFIIGSKECLLNEDDFTSGKPVVMTEAFLDAISIEQGAGDIVVATSTDGSTSSRSLRCQARLGYAPYVLLAFDNDPAGMDASNFWGAHLKNALFYPVPTGSKDANDFLMANSAEQVRQWIAEKIEHVQAQTTHVPPTPSLPALQEEVSESYPVCALCSGEIYAYTDEGTPCCERCYTGQQAIERAITNVVTTTIQKPTSDPLTAFATTVDAIAGVFCHGDKGCTITKHPQEYTLAQHAAFLSDQAERAMLAKEIAMRRLVADRRFKRLHPETIEQEQVEEEE